jgi:hypothetical protein
MSYDYTTKCLVCPRYHDAAPCTHYECSHYCSDECKVVDMPVHKTLCKSFAQFKALSGLHKRRAIYLPVDGSHPEFVWLEMDEQTDYTDPNFPAMHRDFLGGSKDQIYIRIRQDMLSMASTLSDHPEIILVYGSIPPYTDQPLNESVSALLGKQVHDVRGPVIAYGLLEEAFKDGHYVTDLDTTDLGVIANWFLGIHREAKVTMLAVRVNSDREQRLSGRRFEPRSSECILPYASGECGTISQISVIFGMPLMIMMGAEGPNLGRTPQMLDRIKEIRSQLPPDSGNRTVTLLLIYMGNHILTADKDFGTIPEQYVSDSRPCKFTYS